MQLKLIENGLDSLRRGYDSLKDFEHLFMQDESQYKKSIALKNAIINTHHGVEILMKHLLMKNSEYLVFSSLDENVRKAYKEKHQNKLQSIFEASNIDKLHTVSFIEAYERLKTICNDSFSKEFEDKIRLLNLYRNRLTHSEIKIDDQDVVVLFNGFIDELDLYLLEKLGDNYKTLSGYSELIRNKTVYENWLKENNMLLKAEVIVHLADIFQRINLNMGLNEVKRILDIERCVQLFQGLLDSGFKLGMDIFNGFNSGNVSEIKRVSENHLSLYAKDTNSKDVFKFKSLIIYNPKFDINFSPIFIFESEEDPNLSDDEQLGKRQENRFTDKYHVEGMILEGEEEPVYDPKRIERIIEQVEIEGKKPSYTRLYKFISHTIFCMINIQGLNYKRFDRIVSEYYDRDGAMLEMEMKQRLT